MDDALLLTLPGLAEVVIEVGDAAPRTLRRQTEGAVTVVEDSREGTTRWRTASAHGPLDQELLADRPVEERLRPHWSVTWAVPTDDQGRPVRPRTSPVVHAPTPSDEPLGVPALLIASFPLDTTRRHTAPGPLTDFLVRRAADVYTELLAGWRPVTEAAVDLVPGPLGKGELDGALRQALLERLPRTAFLPPALPGEGGEDERRRRCGPGTRRSWRAPVPRPCGCSPRCCPPCCPPVWSAAPSCAPSVSPGSRSPTPWTGSRAWRRTPTGGGGSTTASPGWTSNGYPDFRCRSWTAVRPSAPARCCCPPPTAPGSTRTCSPGSA